MDLFTLPPLPALIGLLVVAAIVVGTIHLARNGR